MPSRLSDSLIAGSVSGGIARLLGSPLDVLKIRFQLQLEPIEASPTSKYSGVLSATKTILREEGISAFWKGFLPGECLYILYGGTQFVCFEGCKRFLKTLLPTYSALYSPGINFVSGCVAGAAATVVSFPFDILRTRMVGQGEPKVYKHSVQAISVMYRENGIRTFYRGLTPALLSVVPYIGLTFTSYGAFTNLWEHTLNQRLSGLKPLVCGVLAGVLPKLLLMPLDFTKKRLEVQGFEKARAQFGGIGRYTGFLNCLLSVYRNEGLTAFYKGAVPTILKAAVTVSASFTIYEHTQTYLKTFATTSSIQ